MLSQIYTEIMVVALMAAYLTQKSDKEMALLGLSRKQWKNNMKSTPQDNN